MTCAVNWRVAAGPVTGPEESVTIMLPNPVHAEPCCRVTTGTGVVARPRPVMVTGAPTISALITAGEKASALGAVHGGG